MLIAHCRASFFSIVLIVALFYDCAPRDSLTGTSSGVETKIARGILVDEDGNGSAHAVVLLIPSSYDPVSGGPLPDNFLDTTDASGQYAFRNIDTGAYNILSTQTLTGTMALQYAVILNADSVDILTDTLRKPGAITVLLPGNADALQGYVYVPGTPIVSFLNGNEDSLVLSRVPEGTIPSVRYSALNSKVSNVIRYDIRVISGDTAAIADPDWTHSKRLFLNTTASGADVQGAILDFPVLVRLTKDNFNFSEVQTSGNDLRFTKADNTPLSFEIERFDPAAQLAEVWIKVDTVYGNDNSHFIAMYWGNPAASGVSEGAAVFDTAAGFQSVWHMNENPSAGANAIKDRTANGHNGTPVGTMSGGDVMTGMIGNALNFNGQDAYVSAGVLNLTGSYALSCWVNSNDLSSARRFIWKEFSYTLWYDAIGAGIRVEHFTNAGIWRGIYQDGGNLWPLSTGVWYYLVGTYDGNKIRYYLNGETKDSTQTIGVNPNSSDQILSLGGRPGELVSGTMDEVRIENIARSADWIKLCYMNQKSEDQLVVVKNNAP